MTSLSKIGWERTSLQNGTTQVKFQGVELLRWVITRPLACLAPSARSADAREARFLASILKNQFPFVVF